MTIWILALLLLASLAGLGYRQGAIRVAFSLVGILIGALLASPLSRLVKPILSSSGVKNPVLLWLIPPLIVFIIIMAIFKVAALATHQKVEVYYKYQAGDLRLALWERLNHRLGLCLGLANGTAYFVLLVMAIFPLSYWTCQMSAQDSDPRTLRIVNLLGRDLQNSGMSKVARAVDKNPPEFYQTADIVGLIYHHPLLEARLSRYPAFLGLAERAEFQDLGNDTQFADLRQKQASVAELLDYPKVQAMLQNPDLLSLIQQTVKTNLTDLQAFLTNGVSKQYNEPLLGRWDFDANSTMLVYLRAKPNMPANQKSQMRRWLSTAFAKATFVATTEQQAFLKNLPRLANTGQATDLQTTQGHWKGADGSYALSMTTGDKAQELTAQVQGDRLTISGSGFDLVFVRED